MQAPLACSTTLLLMVLRRPRVGRNAPSWSSSATRPSARIRSEGSSAATGQLSRKRPATFPSGRARLSKSSTLQRSPPSMQPSLAPSTAPPLSTFSSRRAFLAWGGRPAFVRLACSQEFRVPPLATEFLVSRARPAPQMRLRPPLGPRIPAIATGPAFLSVCATDGHAVLGCRDVTGSTLGEVFRLELVEEGAMEAPPHEQQPGIWDQGRAELHSQQARTTQIHLPHVGFLDNERIRSNALFMPRRSQSHQAQRRERDLLLAAQQSPALLRAPSAPLPGLSVSRQPSTPLASLSRGGSMPADSAGGEGGGGGKCESSLSVPSPGPRFDWLGVPSPLSCAAPRTWRSSHRNPSPLPSPIPFASQPPGASGCSRIG